MRRPGHASRHAQLQGVYPAIQDLLVDVGDFADGFGEFRWCMFLSKKAPIFGVKEDDFWSNELLKRPASCEPATVAQIIVEYAGVCSSEDWFDVGEIGIALGRLFIPKIHGVDGLGQLSAAGLVDAASVDPYVIESPTNSKLGSAGDLDVALLQDGGPSLLIQGLGRCQRGLRKATKAPQLLNADFFIAPGVRQDGVGRDAIVGDVDEPQRSGV